MVIWRGLGIVLVCAAACAHPPPPVPVPPPPKLPEPKARAPRPPPPAEWYWQPVIADVHAPPRKPLAFPVAEAAIVKNDAVWNALAPDAREKLRNSGVLVQGSEVDPLPKDALTFGAFYTQMNERKAPLLVTVDALFAATRLGLEAALARAEEQLAPVLESFLTKLDLRLTAEQKGVGATLAEAYRIARGMIAVTRTLSGKPAPSDLAAPVNAEKALIEAHAVTATSPIMGYPIDYTRFVMPPAAARPNAFRALAWLGSAALPVSAHAETPGAPLDTAQTRTTTRAAMLLARLCDADVDAETNALYTRIARYLTFVWGASDDLTLVELDQIGSKAGVDLTKPEHIIDVAKVDKVRDGAVHGRAPALYDGPGGMGRSVRLFGGHASPDAIALEALLGPNVGLAQEGAPPSLQRNTIRVVPTTLDVAAWLSAPGAKAALHETHADAFDRFDLTLGKLVDAQDIDGAHSSIFESFLAAAGMLATEAQPAAPGPRLESVLSTWTMVRHVDQPFARALPKSAATSEPPINDATVLVENAPEAIARLVATVRQARRGLEGIGALTPESGTALASLEELLKTALTAAEHRANEEPLSAADRTAIAALPARIAALESDEPAQISAIVAGDSPSRRVLVTALGRIEPIYELTRDIGRDEPLLVVGAHIAQHEIVTDAGEAPTDATWRTRAAGASRAAYTSAFRLVPASRNPP